MCRDGLMMFVESFGERREKNVNLICAEIFYERSFDNWKVSLEGEAFVVVEGEAGELEILGFHWSCLRFHSFLKQA
jgi:hypothetical protein